LKDSSPKLPQPFDDKITTNGEEQQPLINSSQRSQSISNR